MKVRTRASAALVLTAMLTVAACGGGRDSDAGSPGITDDSITLGGTFALSGPVAIAGQVAEGAKAAVAQVNADGGVNGRKIKFVVANDEFDPTITVQQTRKLIEKDGVFALTGSVSQPVVREQINKAKVPSLFMFAAHAAWSDEYDKYPWTMSAVVFGGTTGANFAEHLKTTNPTAKVAVLYQNDDSGTDPLKGFKRAIEGTGVTIVAEVPYEVTAPTTAPLVSKLKRSGADTVLNVGSPQPVTQAIKEMSAIGWAPEILVPQNGAESALLKDAGESAKNVLSDIWWKDPSNPEFADDEDVTTYLSWLKKVSPKTDPNQRVSILGYVHMQMMIEALKTMKEPTRAGLLKAAQNLDTTLPMLLDGVQVKTGDGDPLPIEDEKLQQWTGSGWKLLS
jgi:branched-chain amino acid transport system substrate-binding protein